MPSGPATANAELTCHLLPLRSIWLTTKDHHASEFTEEELDSFIDEFADALVFGYGRGVSDLWLGAVEMADLQRDTEQAPDRRLALPSS